MKSSNAIEELTQALLTYLPESSITINEILEILKSIIDNDEKYFDPNVEEDIKQKVRHILDESAVPLVTSSTKFLESVDADGISQEDRDLFNKHKLALSNLVKGLKTLLTWLRDENKPDELLNQSIDELFVSSQMILTLVDLLTQKEK